MAGVKAGDWSRYDLAQHTTGNSTSASGVENQYKVFSNATIVTLNITEVVGTNVSSTTGIHYTNGSTTLRSSTTDISQGIDQNDPPMIIMKNYPTPQFQTQGYFSRVSRILNTITINAVTGDNSSALRYSWDNDTGVLLSEQLLYSISSNSPNNATFALTLALTSTSLWHFVPPTGPQGSPPPGPLGLTFAELYIMIGIAVSASGGLFALFRRKPRAAPRRSRPRPR